MEGAGSRQSLRLTDEQKENIRETFNVIDKDGNTFIDMNELQEVLKELGFDLPSYRIRKLIEDFDDSCKDNRIDIDEFEKMYMSLKSEMDIGSHFKKLVTKRRDLETHAGMSEASSEGTTHSVRKEEQLAFTDWINKALSEDKDCCKYLPIKPEGKDLYEKLIDGILLCKLINKSAPETIDERTINKQGLDSTSRLYKCHENLTLALNSAQSIGCNIVNIGANDLETAKPHLVLGLLWQIIRIGLLSEINLQSHPGLMLLLEEGETIEDLMKLSPEAILIRWVNYHLRNSGCGRQISNFTSDIKDSIVYINLLQQIDPKEEGSIPFSMEGVEHEPDLMDRAELMLCEAAKINCRSFVTPHDVVNMNPKLNLAFVANLFNMYPALNKPADMDDFEIMEETREQKTYRNWMNSMGVSPFVHRLYSDLDDGLIIFQLYEKIKPGIVNWDKVNKKPFHKMKATFQKIENLNYAVELGKQMKFSLIGVGGKDIFDGNTTLTLALLWQAMRAYTLSVLSALSDDTSKDTVTDKQICEWANAKLKNAGKSTSVSSFQDPALADGHIVIDLIDAIKPRAINYDLVKKGENDEERLANAKYAISMARKIGARVYALPEDIVEVKHRMVMTVFACLMTRDVMMKKNKGEEQ